MKYLKVFVDFAEELEPLSDAECGRLFKAMLGYASTGAVPALSGNERFLWAGAKKSIDRQDTAYQNKVQGAEQARSKKSLISVDIKSNQVDCERNELISSQDKDKEKTKTKTEDKDTNIVLLTQNSSAKADYRAVAEAYNEICSPPLPQVKQLSDDRKRHIKTGSARLVEAGLSWRDYFSLAADSDFLMGRDGRWQGCGFDWLIGPKNMLKVLEGNYCNRLTPEQEKALREQAETDAWIRGEVD